MRVVFWIASWWPGFAPAWLAAKWEGLLLAAVFTAALNSAVLMSFVWPEWLGHGSTWGVSGIVSWLVVLGLGIGGVVWLWRDGSLKTGTATNVDPELEARFCEAQHEYLKGHWIEAEGVVREMLNRRPDDVEAGLLLAAIQRRTRLFKEARKTLASLKLIPAAAAWELEIRSEMQQIAELEKEGTSEEANDRASAA